MRLSPRPIVGVISLSHNIMNNKTIGIAALAILAIGGLMWWGSTGSARAPDASPEVESPLTAEENVYDFGLISMKDGTVSRTFTVRNGSSADVLVTDVFTSCMCTEAFLLSEGEVKRGPFGMPGHGSSVPKANETIPAGTSLEIEVVYDPNAHGPAGVGAINRFIYLKDSGGGTLSLEIKANVTP